jgi:hypothetical protein
MAAKKKAKKAKKAKVKSSKRSTKRSVKDLSPRAKAKSVKGRLLPAVHVAFDKYRGASPTTPTSINHGAQVMGDGSV